MQLLAVYIDSEIHSPMPFSDDAALNTQLNQLRQTDATAFIELLFKTFYAPLGGIVFRVVPDRDAVEDLLQDVFLKMWQGLNDLPEITSYRAYLTRMALNAALRYRQRDQRQVAWEDAPADTAPFAPNALNELYAVEAGEAVAAALEKLPPQCRVIFELSRYEELSYQQIAEALELSPKTVENQMGKALRIMRRELAGVLKNLYSLLLWMLVAKGAMLLKYPAKPAAGYFALPPLIAQQAFLQVPRRGNAPIKYLLPVAVPAALSDI